MISSSAAPPAGSRTLAAIRRRSPAAAAGRHGGPPAGVRALRHGQDGGVAGAHARPRAARCRRARPARVAAQPPRAASRRRAPRCRRQARRPGRSSARPSRPAPSGHRTAGPAPPGPDERGDGRRHRELRHDAVQVHLRTHHARDVDDRVVLARRPARAGRAARSPPPAAASGRRGPPGRPVAGTSRSGSDRSAVGRTRRPRRSGRTTRRTPPASTATARTRRRVAARARIWSRVTVIGTSTSTETLGVMSRAPAIQAVRRSPSNAAPGPGSRVGRRTGRRGRAVPERACRAPCPARARAPCVPDLRVHRSSVDDAGCAASPARPRRRGPGRGCRSTPHRRRAPAAPRRPAEHPDVRARAAGAGHEDGPTHRHRGRVHLVDGEVGGRPDGEDQPHPPGRRGRRDDGQGPVRSPGRGRSPPSVTTRTPDGHRQPGALGAPRPSAGPRCGRGHRTEPPRPGRVGRPRKCVRRRPGRRRGGSLPRATRSGRVGGGGRRGHRRAAGVPRDRLADRRGRHQAVRSPRGRRPAASAARTVGPSRPTRGRRRSRARRRRSVSVTARPGTRRPAAVATELSPRVVASPASARPRAAPGPREPAHRRPAARPGPRRRPAAASTTKTSSALATGGVEAEACRPGRSDPAIRRPKPATRRMPGEPARLAHPDRSTGSAAARGSRSLRDSRTRAMPAPARAGPGRRGPPAASRSSTRVEQAGGAGRAERDGVADRPGRVGQGLHRLVGGAAPEVVAERRRRHQQRAAAGARRPASRRPPPSTPGPCRSCRRGQSPRSRGCGDGQRQRSAATAGARRGRAPATGRHGRLAPGRAHRARAQAGPTASRWRRPQRQRQPQHRVELVHVAQRRERRRRAGSRSGPASEPVDRCRGGPSVDQRPARAAAPSDQEAPLAAGPRRASPTQPEAATTHGGQRPARRRAASASPAGQHGLADVGELGHPVRGAAQRRRAASVARS